MGREQWHGRKDKTWLRPDNICGCLVGSWKVAASSVLTATHSIWKERKVTVVWINSLVQGCFMLSREEILHEQWHAAEALQNCIHVAEVAHVSAQPVLTARRSHSTELAASLLLQHNTFLLGHRKHRIQALIIKSDLLRRNTVFSHEDSREDCTNWCQWEMAEVRLFIQTYRRAELRLWQRLENDKMQENKIQNAKQSLQQEICCSTAARAGRKLPAAYHYLKWMLLFSVNSVFVQTQRRLPLTAHLLKGERQKFQYQKTNTAICLDIKASC